MANNSYKDNKRFWFGTKDWMQWIDVPLSGADVSPTGWEAEGTTLGGGGFALGSVGSHKRYSFEWRKSSARRQAQLLKDYRDGAYGRGLIYFIDPLTYDTNVLPARWANPSMTFGEEGSTLVYGVSPLATVTSNFQTNRIPSTRVTYDLANVAAGYRGVEDSVFIPIPEGYELRLGAMYSATGTGGVFYSPVNANGTVGAAVALTQSAVDATNLVPDVVPTGLLGIQLWVGKTAVGAATVNLAAMTGRMVQIGKTLNTTGPWVGGQGHSGCNFLGTPTYVNNTGMDGGQVSFAASFVEVGSWIYG